MNKYFEGHVGWVDGSEEGNEDSRTVACSKWYHCQEEEDDEDVSWSDVQEFGNFSNWFKFYELVVYFIEERVDGLFDVVESFLDHFLQ